MSGFGRYHPIVNFSYFTAVILFSMFFMHPVCLGISLASGFFYSVLLNGRRAARFQLLYLLPLMLISALLNPAFNHEGATILTYLPSGNPLTLESLAFGLGAAVMIGAVISWFSCYHAVMTSDKFIYLFGRMMPAMSLILSMVLRFVPKFRTQIHKVAEAQRGIGRDISCGSVIARARHGLTILSVMVTWALENAIETADSMRSRGYGLPGRTAFSVFTFDRRDRTALFVIASLSVYVLIGAVLGGNAFRYFPTMKGAGVSVYHSSVFVAYGILCLIPAVIELWEAHQWKAIESKI